MAMTSYIADLSIVRRGAASCSGPMDMARSPVFARDGWRCAVPVCTARRELHDHHLVFRSRGGGNGRENRITLCAWHHLRGVLAGRVQAECEAPHAVTWAIGVRTGRRPLLRLVGERYATS